MTQSLKIIFRFKNYMNVSIALQGENHIIAVMSLLSGNQISQACRLAQEAHDHRLALLVAQAAGADFPRKLLAEQLLNWSEQKVRITLFMLCNS